MTSYGQNDVIWSKKELNSVVLLHCTHFYPYALSVYIYNIQILTTNYPMVNKFLDCVLYINSHEDILMLSFPVHFNVIHLHTSHADASSHGLLLVYPMVPTYYWPKRRTFQGPFQDWMQHDKDFYGVFHGADKPKMNHTHIDIENCCSLASFRTPISLNWRFFFYILEEI